MASIVSLSIIIINIIIYYYSCYINFAIRSTAGALVAEALAAAAGCREGEQLGAVQPLQAPHAALPHVAALQVPSHVEDTREN